MELPITIVFEPPSQEELRALVRMRGFWVAALAIALAIGICFFLWTATRAEALAGAAEATIRVQSIPDGAAVEVDGHARGSTPTEVSVASGAHTVVLKTHAGLDQEYTVEAPDDGSEAIMRATLWRRQPTMARLRPALPGALLRDARFVDGGQLALEIELPGPLLQGWRLDPHGGVLEPVGDPVASTRLEMAADGRRLAYVGYEVGPPSDFVSTSTGQVPTVLWYQPEAGHPVVRGWRPPLAGDERLVGASWNRTGSGMLIAAERSGPEGTVETRLWWFDPAHGVARDAFALPSGVVVGSEAWSPDGTRVAFVAHTGQLNALCLLEVSGGFRYLADLEPSSTEPLPFPVAQWSTDGQQLLFVAPKQHPPGAGGNWLQPDPERALYVARSADSPPAQLLDTSLESAVWREDGGTLGLRRGSSDGVLSLDALAPGGVGGPRQLLELPLRVSSSFGTTWDSERARLLIALPSASGGADYWLAMLGLEDGE